jgi:general secretion pathway protein B
MSYILEALRRAEAERERPRGEPLDLAPAPLPAAPRRAGALPWLLLGAVALGAAGAATWWGWPTATPASTAMATPAPAPRPELARAAEPASAPLPAPPVLLQQAPARSLPAAAAPASAPAPAERIPRLAELPAATRQQLPPLQLGGSMHSPEARLRSLILNGQLYREGDWVTPQLQVEAIGVRSAVLRFGRQRFELPY